LLTLTDAVAALPAKSRGRSFSGGLEQAGPNHDFVEGRAQAATPGRRIYEHPYNASMKPVRFVGGAKADLSAFPAAAKLRAGHEPFMVQVGREPDDWKPMPTVGVGAREIRVRDAAGQYRVIYVASFRTAVYVLHAFQKKSRKTRGADLKRAQRRYREAKAIESEG
jgi:phage-related protein